MSGYGSTHYLWGRAALIAFAILSASSVTPVFAQYQRVDLASNQPGVAPSTDQQRLINSWGLTAAPTSPFWVSDNGSGFSTLYNGTGQQNPLFVTIPPSSSDANGNPIEIDNVWALQFGQDGGPNGAHNQLFFTGGPNGYTNGIFGVITFGQ